MDAPPATATTIIEERSMTERIEPFAVVLEVVKYQKGKLSARPLNGII
jgi:hypothetical protein